MNHVWFVTESESEFIERDNDLQVEIYYLITGLPNVIDSLEVILKR